MSLYHKQTNISCRWGSISIYRCLGSIFLRNKVSSVFWKSILPIRRPSTSDLIKWRAADGSKVLRPLPVAAPAFEYLSDSEMIGYANHYSYVTTCGVDTFVLMALHIGRRYWCWQPHLPKCYGFSKPTVILINGRQREILCAGAREHVCGRERVILRSLFKTPLLTQDWTQQSSRHLHVYIEGFPMHYPAVR